MNAGRRLGWRLLRSLEQLLRLGAERLADARQRLADADARPDLPAEGAARRGEATGPPADWLVRIETSPPPHWLERVRKAQQGSVVAPGRFDPEPRLGIRTGTTPAETPDTGSTAESGFSQGASQPTPDLTRTGGHMPPTDNRRSAPSSAGHRPGAQDGFLGHTRHAQAEPDRGQEAEWSRRRSASTSGEEEDSTTLTSASRQDTARDGLAPAPPDESSPRRPAHLDDAVREADRELAPRSPHRLAGNFEASPARSARTFGAPEGAHESDHPRIPISQASPQGPFESLVTPAPPRVADVGSQEQWTAYPQQRRSPDTEEPHVMSALDGRARHAGEDWQASIDAPSSFGAGPPPRLAPVGLVADALAPERDTRVRPPADVGFFVGYRAVTPRPDEPTFSASLDENAHRWPELPDEAPQRRETTALQPWRDWDRQRRLDAEQRGW